MDETGRRSSVPESGFVLPRAGSRMGESLSVIGSIGGSGLGIVYECEDEAIGRRVAVKLLAPDRATTPARVEAFSAAARALARVTCPNVVSVYDVGSYHGLPYLVMEHVPGVTLAEQRRAHGGRLRPAVAIEIIDSVLRALTALHSAGIAHGGVHPESILVAPNGRVVLTNAGFARIVADSDRPLPPVWHDYLQEAPLRTPGDGSIDPREARSDVQASVAVLYELLTGLTPRAARNAHHGALPAPSDLAHVPTPLDAPIVEALTRPTSPTTDTARAFRRVVEGLRRYVDQNLEHKRILVVEDDVEVAGPLADYLTEALSPAEVQIAQDGPTALRLADATSFNLVVLDLGLPGMNGLELTSALRSTSRAKDVPILVLTGRGTSSDWRVLSALGANSLLMKPVSLEVIAATAEELIASRRPARKR